MRISAGRDRAHGLSPFSLWEISCFDKVLGVLLIARCSKSEDSFCTEQNVHNIVCNLFNHGYEHVLALRAVRQDVLHDVVAVGVLDKVEPFRAVFKIFFVSVLLGFFYFI